VTRASKAIAVAAPVKPPPTTHKVKGAFRIALKS
jgi:hypothetical protein